jgi:hypothetical protein
MSVARKDDSLEDGLRAYEQEKRIKHIQKRLKTSNNEAHVNLVKSILKAQHRLGH